MQTERWLVLFAALALFACEPVTPAPFVMPRDSGRERPDATVPFTRVDSGTDSGPGSDAGGVVEEDAGLVDGGTPAGTPTIDGVIDPTEWEGALESTSSTAPAFPFEGDQLTRLLVRRTTTRLYIAVEGMLEPGHSFLVYVDADTDSDRGVLLVSGTELSDTTGLLDRALSTGLTTTIPTLRIDYAWGTTQMPAGPTGSLDEVGWRDIATRPDDFITITSGANLTACSETACETSIAFGAGAIDRATTLSVFARLGDALGNLSNQTLPMDDPSAPELVSVLLVVP